MTGLSRWRRVDLHANSGKEMQMNRMSPLLLILLKALRISMWAMSALMLVFLSIGLWHKQNTTGLEALTRQDYTFFGILVLIGFAGLWMARAVGREIRNSGT